MFCSDEYSTRGKLSRLGIKMESWLCAGKVSLIFSPHPGREFHGLFFFEFYSRLEGIFQNDPLLMPETRKNRTHTPIFACNIPLQRLL